MILISLTLAILTGLISVNNIRTKPYRKLEDKIVESMKKYYGQDTNLKKLPSNEKEVKITVDELIDFGLKIDMEIDKDKCTGYGIVKGMNLSHKYKSYIKCDKYTSKNYKN